MTLYQIDWQTIIELAIILITRSSCITLVVSRWLYHTLPFFVSRTDCVVVVVLYFKLNFCCTIFAVQRFCANNFVACELDGIIV